MPKSLTTRMAKIADISAMVDLSDEKRRQYEIANPKFWQRADNASEVQSEWFFSLLNNPDYLIYIAEEDETIIGFVVGQKVTAPSVYNPGGLTLLVDDFCVKTSEQWSCIGSQLITTITEAGMRDGVTQLLVVCGSHDNDKKSFLNSLDLHVTSEWYVKQL